MLFQITMLKIIMVEIGWPILNPVVSPTSEGC